MAMSCSVSVHGSVTLRDLEAMLLTNIRLQLLMMKPHCNYREDYIIINACDMQLKAPIFHHVGCQTPSHSTATTQITATTPTTTRAGSITTSTDLVDPNQQGHNNIIYIGN